MLQNLHVKNLALIDEIEVEFGPARQVEELIGRNMENIAEYIENLQTILREAPRDEFFQDHALQKKLEMLYIK